MFVVVNTRFQLSNWRDVILSFIFLFFLGLGLVEFLGLELVLWLGFIVRISFLVRERVSICDSVVKFVDKMMSYQFSS